MARAEKKNPYKNFIVYFGKFEDTKLTFISTHFGTESSVHDFHHSVFSIETLLYIPNPNVFQYDIVHKEFGKNHHTTVVGGF